MDSLFETLYAYAVSERCGFLSKEEREDLEASQKMVRCAVEELTAKGLGDPASRVKDGMDLIAWQGQRSLFRAGLSIGMELGRL